MCFWSGHDDDPIGGRQLGHVAADRGAELIAQGTLEEAWMARLIWKSAKAELFTELDWKSRFSELYWTDIN